MRAAVAAASVCLLISCARDLETAKNALDNAIAALNKARIAQPENPQILGARARLSIPPVAKRKPARITSSA